MLKSKRLSFAGQTFHIGIDTHKTNWRVTLRSNAMELRTFSMNPSPDELAAHMKTNYPDGSYRSVYEAGYCGYWIHRRLEKCGITNLIVNPADVPTTDKEKDQKDDPIDSRKLARELSNGSLRGIYIPDEYHESIRVLSRTLRQYSKRNTQVKNRIKALFCFLGVDCPVDAGQRWSKALVQKIAAIQFPQANLTFVMQRHLCELEHVRQQLLLLLKEIRILSKNDRILKALRSIPGIGSIIAFTLYAELITMHRFPRFDEVASFVGLVPSTARSGKKIVVKGITQRHNRYLRYLLIEAAWVAVRHDPVLTQKFNDLCKYMTKQRAIVRIAKKLLNRIRAVWKTGQQYVIGTIESCPAQVTN
jgi:transposase